MCPNGVEFKTLGEVCKTSMGEFVKKDKQNPNAPYPVYNGGSTNTGFYDDYNTEANKVIISARGAAGFVNKVEVPFWTGNSCHVIDVIDNKLNWRFLYYYLKNHEYELIANQQKGGGVPAVSKKQIEAIEIPLPPLEIQKKIVECLDKFSALAAELQAELQLRRKQYEYYRTQLLTPHSDCNSATKPDDAQWEWKTLGELCTKIVSGGTPARNHAAYFNGTIPWMRTQEVDWKDVYDTEIHITEEAVKNSSAKLIPANCVIIAMYGATAGKSCINKIPVTTNQACCNLEIDTQKALYKYVYYCVCKEYENIKGMGEGSQNNINGQKIKSYKIPLPSLAEQARIVSILDKFEALTTSLSDGIPAEQAAQQKRYEYYRDLLLTFDRKAE